MLSPLGTTLIRAAVSSHLFLCALQVVRKERAAGVVPQRGTVYEVLEELAITVQRQLVDAPLPFCAFNGGGDVFVDVGNKSLGLEALMSHLGYQAHQVGTDGQLCIACLPAVLLNLNREFTWV